MTETTNRSHSASLVARYLSGEMDTGEKLRFEQQLLEDQHLSNEFVTAKDAWELMDYYTTGTINNVNTDKAWEDLSTRIIGNENAVTHHQQNRVFPLPVWLQWAAAVLLIVGLGWVGYMKWVQSADESWLVLENTDTERVVVKTLQDGSVVYLAQNTQISYPGLFDDSGRNVQMTGEAFFDVAHDESKPFTIKAGDATIEVLGTSFNVRSSQDNALELFVETGRVKVWFDTTRNESLLVSEGQLLKLSNGLAEVQYPAYYDTRWRKDLLQFKDESLRNILSALAKTYGYTFETTDESLNNRIMTLTIDDSSIETVGELIALSLSVDYEIKDNSRVVFSNPR